MATTTVTTPVKKKQPKARSLWPIFVALGALVVILVILVARQIGQPIYPAIPYRPGQSVGVHYNEHAMASHPEASLVRQGCERGPEMTWKHNRVLRFIFLCQLDDGRWGMMIIEKVQDVWEEVTSFVKSDGSKARALEYLRSFATPFKGLLP